MSMTKSLHAVFDGKVLKPEKPADLERGKRYVLTVERIIETKTSGAGSLYPLTQTL